MIKKALFLKLVKEGEFERLFTEELGWDRYRGRTALPTVSVDGTDFRFRTIADRSGFQIIRCDVDEIPTQSLARKLDSKLRRQAQDYICIFRKNGTAHDLWMVPVRANEKRELVMVEYTDAKAEVIYQKIDGITFDFSETTNIVDLRQKVQGAFVVNSEKITKDFYSGFRKEHKAFAELISGIDDHIVAKDNRNKQWYASVMLNRLMFCYFIQKKGFLDLDTDYLRHKLDMVQSGEGSSSFYNFYRSFLRVLFHDGLNAPKHDRAFEKTFGRIPYLNGGMFDRHQLELEYPDIDIPDDAFRSLFDFFDKWNWHLDTRLTASGKDINPDVLGYIFEQYINDRAQMGAYYTKEDITEYIGRNCILPFLFDAVKKSTKDAEKDFTPDGFVWKTLRESGDKYIFDAVKKGYDRYDSVPDNIKKGIITPDMRKEYSETPIGELPESHVPLSDLRADWNTRTPEEWGLPNEIWRETMSRLQRCDDVINKIRNGEITGINDFITYNLDIRSFATDLLSKADSRFVGRFYHALQKVTVLDPTCGSGAFLFAAMNILEPLYEICIERMQEFHSKDSNFFKNELAEITNKYRSNIQYFIFKSIILRNLYGVDIMVEATEIAKLRLFLKMVAVVDVDKKLDNLGLDPLPDIDFNIRCGNTLVGYANVEQLSCQLDHAGDILQELANQDFKVMIEEEMRKVAAAYRIFVYCQLRQEEDMSSFKEAKLNLNTLLQSLNDKLNHRLHEASNPDMAFPRWMKIHQPFHWLAEFYQIIVGNGGFDVVIGNPPYVNIKKIDYIGSSKEFVCSDLYGFVLRRIGEISSSSGIQGMIVMHNIAFSKDFEDIRRLLHKSGEIWWSFYSRIPSGLFDGSVRVRNAIYIKRGGEKDTVAHSTRLHRWYSEQRPALFYTMEYGKIPIVEKIPMTSVFENISFIKNSGASIAHKRDDNGNVLYLKKIGYNWLCLTEEPPKSLDVDGTDISYLGVDDIGFDRKYIGAISLFICGKVGFLKWMVYGDDFHVTKNQILSTFFPIQISEKDNLELRSLYKNFKRGLRQAYQTKLNCGQTIGSYNIASLWHITDQSDKIILKYTEPFLTEESLYDIYTEVVKTAIAVYKE